MIKNKSGIKFHSELIYEQIYLKVKIREFDGVIKTNFLGHGTPKENMHYVCIACISIDSVMILLLMLGENTMILLSVKKKVYLEESKYRVKNIQMSRFRNSQLDSDSESD